MGIGEGAGAVDFIVTKKRKRHMNHVNSFGFYSVSSPIPPTPANKVDHNEGQGPTWISARAPTPSTSSSDAMLLTASSDSNVHSNSLTVDEFLRRSTLKPTKCYGRGKRRVVDLRDPSASRFNNENHDVLEQKASKRARLAVDIAPKPLRKKKKIKSLAARLIHAAGLSQGDPVYVDQPEESSVSHSRRPLQFVQVNSAFEITRKSRHWNFVDPRKSSPLFGHVDFSSFKSRHHGTVSKTEARKHKPLSGWRTIRKETLHVLPSQISSITEIPHTRRIESGAFRRFPLNFIPVEEAEAAYGSRVPFNERASMPTSTGVQLTSCSLDSQQRQTPTQLDDQPDPRPIVVVIPAPARKDHVPQISASPSNIKSAKRVKFSSPPNSSSSSPTNAPITLSTSHELRAFPEHENNHEQPLPAIEITATKFQGGSLTPPDHQSSVKPQTSPNSPGTEIKKPLIGLTSLLDGFLATARNATQIQASSYPNIQQRSVKRKRGPKTDLANRKSNRDAHMPTIAQDANNVHPTSTVMKPINSSLRSFVRWNSQLSNPTISQDTNAFITYQPLRTLTTQSRLLLPSINGLFPNSSSLLASVNSEGRKSSNDIPANQSPSSLTLTAIRAIRNQCQISSTPQRLNSSPLF